MEGWQGMVRYIADYIINNGLRTKIILLSNGTFLLRGLGEEMSALLDHPAIQQLYLSTNPRYYKDHLSVHQALGSWRHKKLYINKYDRHEVLKNLGRATKLPVNLDVPASCTCMTHVLHRPYKNLKELLNAVPPGQCSPMIGIDGSIHIGWGTECVGCGTVFDDYEAIFERLVSFRPCGRCGQGVMPVHHKST